MEPNTVIFGEVLFDRFPDHQSVLGGAPFNVAWHLQGFGLFPLFVSAVGEDEAGQQILSTMGQWGMDTRGVQRHQDYATGAVQVTLDQGQPSFDILPNQAYDHIETGPVLAVCGNAPATLLYMGTLAGRSPTSRGTQQALIEKLKAPVFVDINLRSPWWEKEQVQTLLAKARWAKLNDAELITVSEQPLSSDELIPTAQTLLEPFGLELLILTLGSEGAAFITKQQIEQGMPVPVPQLADTVGAGDAFSAVTLLGLVQQWSLPVILQRALLFASRICAQRGATAVDHKLYDEMLEQWGA